MHEAMVSRQCPNNEIHSFDVRAVPPTEVVEPHDLLT
jgi:hypothetical protein